MKNNELVIDILATARITRLVTEDYIFEPLRNRLAGVNNKLDYLLECPACASVWGGLIVHKLPKAVRYALAASEATIYLRSIESRISD